MPTVDIYTPEDRAAGVPEREMETARTRGRADDERWHVRKDGSRFFANGILTLMTDETGQPGGFAKILRDFTERKRDQERLERAFAETHHRIKNSLQVACALLEMQTETYGGCFPVEGVERVTNHLQAMATVQDILTQAVKRNATTDQLGVKDVVEKLLFFVQQTSGLKQVRLKCDALYLPSQKINPLAILINELLTNAAKHGADTADLVIAGEEPGWARLEVTDNGPGFPDGFDVAHGANTGLELIQVVTTTDLGGQATFDNCPQGGARIRILFPVPEY